VLTPDGAVDIGTGLARGETSPAINGRSQDKRIVHIDGVAQRGQAVLARRLGVVWLTPAMDRLFSDGPAARRKFLDRLIVAFDPDHAGRTAAYDRALRQRARLLRDGARDAAWYAALEDTLARYGVAVAAARSHMVERLNRTLADAGGPFPSAELGLAGDVDAWLAAMPALDVEDRLRAALARGRSDPNAADAGPHRSDVTVTFRRPGHASHGQPAQLCSTGEQKALLVAIVLAQARLQAAARGHAPILLLDEVAAHLDAERRAALFATVLDLRAQAWMTGTDAGVFEGLAGAVQRLVAGGGAVHV
jgi:DNA replication and repair protein RecF